MRKAYSKPRIAIEDFVLNQYIAGSCTVTTRNKTKAQIVTDLAGYPFVQAVVAAGQFADVMGCALNADDDNDTLCYHTQGSPLFTS